SRAADCRVTPSCPCYRCVDLVRRPSVLPYVSREHSTGYWTISKEPSDMSQVPQKRNVVSPCTPRNVGGQGSGEVRSGGSAAGGGSSGGVSGDRAAAVRRGRRAAAGHCDAGGASPVAGRPS